MVKRIALMAATASLAFASAASAQDLSRVRGRIAINGSSTVYPITEAIAEAFGDLAPNVRVTVGISGTGGGFKRFTVGETDISDASRPIKDKELAAAKESGVSFVEIPVAYDGLSIVVNKGNYWVDSLTVDHLKKIFLEGNPAISWNDVDPSFPDEPIKIFAPGTDSGTFDYFKEVVAGKSGSIRSDMSVSEDDNVLVRGVSGEVGAVGFFGCAYYFENADKLKIVKINGVEPTKQTIEDGSYAPFSRPLFIYVSTKSAKRRDVQAFVKFYLENAGMMAEEVGYVELPKFVYDRARADFKTGKTGTHFLDEKGEKVKGPLPDVYK